MVDAVAKPSTVFDVKYESGYRTSYSGDVEHTDPFVRMIERRIDDLLGIDPSFGETVQGQRYTPGQEFQAHVDWFWTLADYWPEEQRKGGQRSWTAMAYLSEVEEGGQTEFVRLGVSIPPQRGLLLVWNNAAPDGSPNWDTMHAAHPVVRGRSESIRCLDCEISRQIGGQLAPATAVSRTDRIPCRRPA